MKERAVSWGEIQGRPTLSTDNLRVDASRRSWFWVRPAIGGLMLWLAVMFQIGALAQTPAAITSFPPSFDLQPRTAERSVPATEPERVVGVRSNRLVRLFDFEDTDDRGVKLGRGVPMPRHWFGIGREPGTTETGFLLPPRHRELIDAQAFSRYGEIRFDARHRVSGEFSLHLGLAAADVGAFLEMGVLPAVPGSDYQLTAWVRTEALQRAGGVLKAYLVDAQGRKLPASVVTSPPLVTDGQWQQVRLQIQGIFSQAAWLMVEVAICQPQAGKTDPLGDQQVVYRDVAGGLWLDDLAVWQLPSARLWSDAPAGVFSPSQRPRLQVAVRDVAGEDLIAELTVWDHTDRVVAAQRRSVAVGEPTTWSWEPDLPRHGWYRARVRVQEARPDALQETELVAEGHTAWLWRGPQDAAARATEDVGRFVIEARSLSASARSLWPPLLAAAGFRATVLDVPMPRSELATAGGEGNPLSDVVLEALLGRGDQVTLVLPPAAGETGANHAAGSPPWLVRMTPMLLRYGQRVAAWQLEGAAFASEATALPAIGQVQRSLATWVPEPKLLLPRAWEQGPPTESEVRTWPGRPVLQVPARMPREALVEVLGAWPVEGRPRLRWLGRKSDGVDHSADLAHLARQWLTAWMLQAEGLVLADAWQEVIAGDARLPMLVPHPELGVLAGLVDRLAGRQWVATWPLPAGQFCFLLDDPQRQDRPMLVLWSQAPAELNAWLGREPVEVDLWGNRRSFPRQTEPHTVTLGPTPQFIEGIDGGLARLRASLVLDEPFIPSEQRPHARVLTLQNPWPVTMTGELAFTGPAGWHVQPQQHAISLPAGDSLSLPITLQFPVSEPAGLKPLSMRLRFRTLEDYDLTLSLPMELGWRAVQLDPILTVQGVGQDQEAVATVTLTNRSQEPQNLHVFAMLAGHPRQEQWLARLEPGQQAVRQFRFTTAGDALARHPVRVGVRQAGGPAVLSYVLTPPQSP